MGKASKLQDSWGAGPSKRWGTDSGSGRRARPSKHVRRRARQNRGSLALGPWLVVSAGVADLGRRQHGWSWFFLRVLEMSYVLSMSRRSIVTRQGWSFAGNHLRPASACCGDIERRGCGCHGQAARHKLYSAYAKYKLPYCRPNAKKPLLTRSCWRVVTIMKQAQSSGRAPRQPWR